jgi:mono/diheme cytochrome c family protein
MRYITVMNTAALISVVALTACQNTQAPTSEVISPSIDAAYINAPYIKLGQEIAETRCVTCHNTSHSGAEFYADAPPLSRVLEQYNPNALADDFREHIHVGHADMPDFDFTVKETEGLLAYLRAIQETPR